MKLSILSLLLIAYISIHAQSVRQAPAANPDPIVRMEPLIGKWQGKASRESETVPGIKELNVSIEFSKFKKGIKVSTTYQMENEIKGEQETGFIRNDTAAKMLYYTVTNNAGQTFEMKGNWVDNRSLNFDFSGT